MEFKLYIGNCLLTPKKKSNKEKQRNRKKDIRHIENKQQPGISQSSHSRDDIILTRLTTLVKRKKLPEWIRNRTVCFQQQMQFRSKDKTRLWGKGWKRYMMQTLMIGQPEGRHNYQGEK